MELSGFMTQKLPLMNKKEDSVRACYMLAWHNDAWICSGYQQKLL